MPFLSFADNSAMYDATPLDNMFIIENLPTAPENFLKVYIYARMLCLHPEIGNGEELERALGIDEATVENAMNYWERQGLVRRVADQPPEYVFLPVRGGQVNEMERDYYKFRDFDASLQALFPGDKMVHGAQYALANDWVETLHFTQEAALELVRGTIQRSRSKSPTPSSIFKTADRTAAKLADAGITDAEGVRRAMQGDEQASSMARKVLFRLGLRRNPTGPEEQMAAKWLGEWQLTPEEILAACDETVKATNPSFAYLDKILESSRQNDGSFDAVKELLETLGNYQKPNREQRTWYAARMQEGFQPETLRLAAAQRAKRGGSFEGLEKMVTQWKELGLTRLADAEAFVSRNEALLEEFSAILRGAEIQMRPTVDDLAAYEDWKSCFQSGVVEFAAQCARGKRYPISYMRGLLETWREANVTSLEAAQEYQQRPRESGTRPQSNAPKNPALNYEQREYRNEDFEDDSYIEMAKAYLARQQAEENGGD